MKFEWFVAARYLLSRRKQSFISIISVISIAGVGLGVATVILVIAVLNGVEHGIKERFLSNEAHVVLRLMGNNFFSDHQNRIDRITQVEGVAAASPVVYSQMGIFQIGQKSITDAILVKGIDLEQEDKVTGFSQYVSGSVDFQTSPLIEEAELREGETIAGGIVIGYRLASQLGLTEGDVLRLVVKLEENPGSIGHPTLFADFANFVVIGLYKSELVIYDSKIGYIDVDVAQKLYGEIGKVNVILVRLEDAEMASALRHKIEEAAQFSNYIEMPTTTTWLETHSALFAALKMEKIATVIIEALIILVAAFNIASTLIMTVMEKTRDIGTLRTLGASKGNIMRIFMIQGSVIGMLGTLLGTTLGIFLCWLLSTNIDRPKLLYPLIVVGIISLIQVGITFRSIDFAGIVPKISRLVISIFVFISANLILLTLIFGFSKGFDQLTLTILALVSYLRISQMLLIPILIGICFWIIVIVRSWQKMSSKWKIAFVPLWLLVIGFALFCIVEPISLKELGYSEIYQMDQLPIKINWFFVCLINVLSFEICWLATIYPAWQASNLKPIEALQHE